MLTIFNLGFHFSLIFVIYCVYSVNKIEINIIILAIIMIWNALWKEMFTHYAIVNL